MYRGVLFRWLPVRHFKTDLFQVLELNKNYSNEVLTWKRHIRQISLSCISQKKRKSVDERAVENQGKRVIRYSPKAGSEVVGIWRNMTIKEIAGVLQKDVDHVYNTLQFADKNSEVSFNENSVIHNPQIIRDIVKITGFRFKIVPRPDEIEEEEINKDAVPAPPAPPEVLRPRAPVVCVMGHVDHGKTTLLDSLRDTSVVDSEFGGITQHIGAFQVELPSGERVTFLDTPGHAAFTSMRSRGARGADLVVLVVAADDGLMEQTLESMRIARDAHVPILVAINKMDKPGVNIEKTIQELARHGIVCEALGGEVQAIPISALKKQNLDTLVEALTLQAQLMDLRADPGGYVEGVVVEALVDTSTGKQATVLVQRGTLRRGCVLVAGTGWAKVRLLQTAEGVPVEEASPATPVRVLGWREMPSAGDYVIEVKSEKRANEVMKWRNNQRMKEKQASDTEVISEKESSHREEYRRMLEHKRALGRLRLKPVGPRQKMIQDDGQPSLSVVLKGDVDGSVEALLEVLESCDERRVRLRLAHCGLGALTPGDLEIARAFDAIIYAFNVEVPPELAVEAKKDGVQIKRHNVIYKLVDDLKDELSARLPTTTKEEILGEANVLQEFQVSEGKKKVPVAGCRCVRGSLSRNALYRLVRGGEVVYDGKLASMKHLKVEVATIKRDMECGLRFQDTAVSAQPGDSVLCYRTLELRETTCWNPGF